jgi:peptidoglycan/LPS O-acetylase OafA/YrhL
VYVIVKKQKTKAQEADSPMEETTVGLSTLSAWISISFALVVIVGSAVNWIYRERIRKGSHTADVAIGWIAAATIAGYVAVAGDGNFPFLLLTLVSVLSLIVVLGNQGSANADS